MRHAASLRLETAATHGSAFAASKSALSIHSYVDMGGVGPPSAKNRFSASTASADARNTHFVQSTLACNNLKSHTAGDFVAAGPPPVPRETSSRWAAARAAMFTLCRVLSARTDW